MRAPETILCSPHPPVYHESSLEARFAPNVVAVPDERAYICMYVSYVDPHELKIYDPVSGA